MSECEYIIVVDSSPLVVRIPEPTYIIITACATNGGGFSDPMTTRGDIIYRDSANATTRLGRGTANQILKSDGTDISWQDETGGGNIVAGTAQGQMLFWNAGGNTWTYTEEDELFWDDTNKRLGIGTDSPRHPLEIIGNGVSQGVGYFKNTGTGSGITLDRTDGRVGMLLAGQSGVNYIFDNSGYFAIASETAADIRAGTVSLLPSKPLRVDGPTGYVSINKSIAADRRLEIIDAIDPQLRLTHTDLINYTDFQTTAGGALNVTASGNVMQFDGVTSGVIPAFRIRGNNANARMQLFNRAGNVSNWVTGNTATYISAAPGTTLALQDQGIDNCSYFQNVASGETPSLYVYGWNTGEGAKRWGRLNYLDGDFNIDTRTGSDLVLKTGQQERIRIDGVEAKFSVPTKHVVDTSNVSNPPTQAELTAIFGTPATVGAGFTVYLDDNGADTNFYQIVSSGSSWFILSGVKAS